MVVLVHPRARTDFDGGKNCAALDGSVILLGFTCVDDGNFNFLFFSFFLFFFFF